MNVKWYPQLTRCMLEFYDRIIVLQRKVKKKCRPQLDVEWRVYNVEHIILASKQFFKDRIIYLSVYTTCKWIAGKNWADQLLTTIYFLLKLNCPDDPSLKVRCIVQCHVYLYFTYYISECILCTEFTCV